MTNMFKRTALAIVLLTGCGPTLAQNVEPSERTVIEPILERFVVDYVQDPMASDLTFGVEVGSLRWTVTSTTVDGQREVTMTEGFGQRAMLYFKLSSETLNLLDQGVWNGLTAMGAATSADKTPLDILYTEGFEETADHVAVTRRLIFHFWTRGLPEKVRFSQKNSRVVHGAPATALYYDEDFRSAVYFIPAGLGREQAPTIAVPFSRMILITSGSAEGEINGSPFSAQTGDMLFAPANLPVTFWNASSSETLSFVWLMWGKGA